MPIIQVYVLILTMFVGNSATVVAMAVPTKEACTVVGPQIAHEWEADHPGAQVYARCILQTRNEEEKS